MQSGFYTLYISIMKKKIAITSSLYLSKKKNEMTKSLANCTYN